MYHFAAIFIAGGLLIGVTQADTKIQINYYSDKKCTQYVEDLKVTLTSVSDCIKHSSATSVNIASCSGTGTTCICNFYKHRDCNGPYHVVDWYGINCLADSFNYQSIICIY